MEILASTFYPKSNGGRERGWGCSVATVLAHTSEANFLRNYCHSAETVLIKTTSILAKNGIIVIKRAPGTILQEIKR